VRPGPFPFVLPNRQRPSLIRELQPIEQHLTPRHADLLPASVKERGTCDVSSVFACSSFRRWS
jgi:hypothetical protein